MPTRLWGDAQRARYGRIPEAIGEDDIAHCFHLDERDQAIITELRGAHNRLGFPRPSPRRTPASARPQFRIGLLQRLMSVDRSSRTHGPTSYRTGNARFRIRALTAALREHHACECLPPLGVKPDESGGHLAVHGHPLLFGLEPAGRDPPGRSYGCRPSGTESTSQRAGWGSASLTPAVKSRGP